MKKKHSIKTIMILNIIIISMTFLAFSAYNTILDHLELNERQQLMDYALEFNNLTERVLSFNQTYKEYMFDHKMNTFIDFQNDWRMINRSIIVLSSLRNKSDTFNLYFRTLNQVTSSVYTLLINFLAGEYIGDDPIYTLQVLQEAITILPTHAYTLANEFILYSINENSVIAKRYQDMRNIAAIAQFFIFSIVLIILVTVTRDLINRLKRLNKASTALTENNWNYPDLKLSRYSEFTNVAVAFNTMKHEIRNNINAREHAFEVEQKLATQKLENEKQNLLIEQTRNKLLQAQINPHFLFNTLNMIVRTIQNNENEKAVNLIISTSNLLRNSIRIDSNSVPLDQELNLLDDYIEIQKERTYGRISFDIKNFCSPEELKTILLPPFSLQILVENSIKHGFKNTTENGKIVIQIFDDDEGGIFIMVKDNGVGFPQGEIHTMDRFPENHGLCNLRKRLMAIHENKDVISLSSGKNGTNIVLHLKRKEKA